MFFCFLFGAPFWTENKMLLSLWCFAPIAALCINLCGRFLADKKIASCINTYLAEWLYWVYHYTREMCSVAVWAFPFGVSFDQDSLCVSILYLSCFGQYLLRMHCNVSSMSSTLQVEQWMACSSEDGCKLLCVCVIAMLSSYHDMVVR